MKNGHHRTAKQCQAEAAAGGRCNANALNGSEYCFFHHPDRAGERAIATRKGGLSNKARVLPVATPDLPLRTGKEVMHMLAETINQVRRGELDPQVGNTVGYLAAVWLKAQQQESIDQRIAIVETAVKG